MGADKTDDPRDTVQRHTLYRGEVVDLGRESVRLPNGRQTDLEVVRHPGGAAVVALDTRGRVCLLRQFRHAAGDWLWELPAGKIDPGEDAERTAVRELEEEAGLRAGRWKRLGRVLTTPGFCDEIVHLFQATELQQVAAQPQAHEVIEVHWLDYREAVREIRNGTIYDAKTVIGLLLAEL